MQNDSKTRFGIMQGRLVPPEPGRFQAFPRTRWRDEFPNAKAAGIHYIEWIVDAYGETSNPIFSTSGLEELFLLKQEYGLATPAICADWFMDYPFLRSSQSELADREHFLHRLIPVARHIGANRIVLPFVDISSIKSKAEEDLVIRILNDAASIASANGVELHLETDLNPRDFAKLLERVPQPCIKVNYDSGNSSGLGYIASEEFAAYGNRIGSIHIKDRYRNPDGSVEPRPLGQGSADFQDLCACMRAIGYNGGLTLQVARGEDGDEIRWITEQLDFLRACLERSLYEKSHP